MDIRLHTRVTIVKGRLEEQAGTVVRIDSMTGWFFLALDRDKGNPSYRDVQYGPFCAHELETAPGAAKGKREGRRRTEKPETQNPAGLPRTVKQRLF